MKKLITLFAIILIVHASYSQSKLDNEFYFRFGYSSPSWNQFGMEEADWGEGVTKTGAMFELGNIFMINSFPAADNMAVGINVDYLYIKYHNFKQDFNSNLETLGTLRLGSKIGPSFTYNPVHKMAFDIYAKADFGWGIASVLYEDKIENAEDYYKDYFSIGFSTGVNFRYGILILGFEFNTISPELESDDTEGEFIGNANDDSNKSPLPCFNFSLGLSF